MSESAPIVDPQLLVPLWVSDVPVLLRAVRVYNQVGLSGPAGLRRAGDRANLARLDALLGQVAADVDTVSPPRGGAGVGEWLRVTTYAERQGQHLVDLRQWEPGAERALCGAVVGFLWDHDRDQLTCARCLQRLVAALLTTGPP